MTDAIAVGAGAGYAGDRVEPAIALLESVDLDYLVFECLAERTIANAQLERLLEPSRGFSPRFGERMRAALPVCAERGTGLLTNMGAANPAGAAERAREIAAEVGAEELAIATVAGSDVTDRFDELAARTFDDEPTDAYRDRYVSAHAYTGVAGIVEALDRGADVVITDRVADPSLFLAPMVHAFGWDPVDPADAEPVGQGILAAHLLECAGQVTGGYFADPGRKDVHDPARLGFPYATVDSSGDVRISKTPDSGGEVTPRTCTEQLLYEVHDPAEYVTPDAVVDFSGVEFERVDDDVVAARGAQARGRPDTLKVVIGYEGGYVGEGEISYGGPGADERATLAGHIVEERIRGRDLDVEDLRIDRIGMDALFGPTVDEAPSPPEVRLRVAARCGSRAAAEAVAREVQTLYTNGPAGGGGARMTSDRVIGVVSTTIDREAVSPTVSIGGC